MLNLADVDIFYGEIQAIEKVNINIQKGEIVALIGANGAGKSSLINAVSGLIPVKNGEIKFENEVITNKYPEIIVKKGLVQIPEGRQIFPSLTVYENLIMGAYIIKDKKLINKNIKRIFDIFPILDKRKRNAAQTLSGGEQQMLVIGRALMSEPKLLMLDEPSLGIAPILVENIFEIIKKLNQSGLSILLVEQNVFLSLKISTRAYVIERGKIILEGESSALLKDPKVESSYLGI